VAGPWQKPLSIHDKNLILRALRQCHISGLAVSSKVLFSSCSAISEDTQSAVDLAARGKRMLSGLKPLTLCGTDASIHFSQAALWQELWSQPRCR
jgi:hypothetical protein